jgi:hypothetical protein
MEDTEFEQLVAEKFEKKGDQYATMGSVDPKYEN